MSLRKRSLTVLLCSAAAMLFLGAASADDEATPPCTGVVDMRLIFREYEKSIRYDTELEKLERQLKREKAEREKEIGRIQEEAKELEEGSRQQTERGLQAMRAKVELEFWLRDQGELVKEKLLSYTEEVEQDIREASQIVAKEKGLLLVLNNDILSGDDDPQLRGRRVPVVLFVHPTADITKEVLAVLNRPPAGGGAPPPGKEGASPPPGPAREGDRKEPGK